MSPRLAPRDRRIAAVGVALVGLGTLLGCGGDDAASGQPSISPTLLSAPPAALESTTSTTAAATVTSTSAPASTGGTTVGPPVTSTGATPPTTVTAGAVSTAVGTVPTSPPPAATGIPGGASDSALCRNYATVVGSQNVLTVAGAFGDLDTAALARLELIAAPAVVRAATELGAEWPTELASEQILVAESVIAPIVDRAEVAALAVAAAGVDDSVLATAWRGTLAAYDPGTPTVTVTGLAPNVEAALATAASSYAATSVRYDMDPSVTRTAATPLTTEYLFDHCPELSYLIAGDAD